MRVWLRHAGGMPPIRQGSLGAQMFHPERLCSSEWCASKVKLGGCWRLLVSVPISLRRVWAMAMAMSLFSLTQEFEQALVDWNGQSARPLRPAGNRRVQAYSNTFVEYFLAGTHPLLPLLYFGWAVVLAAARIVSGPEHLRHLCTFGFGALAFTFAEYSTHRFAFHRPTGDDRTRRRRSFLVHGLHHLAPKDRWRLMVPPMLSFPLGLTFYAIYALGFGFDGALTPFGGTCLAYLTYDSTHYSIHTSRTARTPWGRVLRRIHMIHHYSDGQRNFGVTSPLWDLCFGTFAWSSPWHRRPERAHESGSRRPGNDDGMPPT
jgi:sterol desaturase/sphingolipid hydroxylase (fatty acid hydroxylase superfamily)